MSPDEPAPERPGPEPTPPLAPARTRTLRVVVQVALPVAASLLIWEQVVLGAAARVYLGAFLLLLAVAVLEVRDRRGRQGVAVQAAVSGLVLAGALDAAPALWAGTALVVAGGLWSLLGGLRADRREDQAR